MNEPVRIPNPPKSYCACLGKNECCKCGKKPARITARSHNWCWDHVGDTLGADREAAVTHV